MAKNAFSDNPNNAATTEQIKAMFPKYTWIGMYAARKYDFKPGKKKVTNPVTNWNKKENT